LDSLYPNRTFNQPHTLNSPHPNTKLSSELFNSHLGSMLSFGFGEEFHVVHQIDSIRNIAMRSQQVI
jgi:hypothetical protein